MTDSFKTRVQQRLAELNLTPEGASKAAGLSRDYIRQMMGHASNPRANSLFKLAKALETTPEWLLTGIKEELSANMHAPNARIGGPVDFPDKKIPVYGQAVGGVDGEFELNGHFIQEVICPPALSQVSDAYAVFVSGESMEPRYFDGELLYVHPHRRPRKGDFVVAQIRMEEHGHNLAFIKRFARWNSKELVIQQYNPAKELTFLSDHVVSVHVVVGTGEG